jgi:hypothetical protein
MIRSRTALLLSALLLAACGGDDDGDGGGGGVSTGLPKDEKLSTLDADDSEKLCTNLAESFNDVLSDADKKRINCVVLALPLSITIGNDGKIAGDIPKCKDLVMKCSNGESISTQPPAIDVDQVFIDENSCTDGSSSEQLAGCDATVAEFESCASAMKKALSKRFDIITCDALSDIEGLMKMSADDIELDNQPECKSLVEKCPDIDFGAGSESEGA